jgi:hypothetical protein
VPASQWPLWLLIIQVVYLSVLLALERRLDRIPDQIALQGLANVGLRNI